MRVGYLAGWITQRDAEFLHSRKHHTHGGSEVAIDHRLQEEREKEGEREREGGREKGREREREMIVEGQTCSVFCSKDDNR